MLSDLTPLKIARLKLSLWYMLIVVVLLVIFTYLTLDAKQSAYIRVHRVLDTGAPESSQVEEFENTFEEFNQRFKQRLFVFDGVMLLVAAFLSYFLSGKTLEQIQRMMEEQEAFAADVSHGLRTPLATILMEIEATKRTTKRIPKDVTILLDSVKEEVLHMKHVTEGLLSLVRTGSDPVRSEFRPVELDGLVKGVYEQMIPVARQKQQKMKLDQVDRVEVLGNEDQLKQVLLILVDNAIKYSGKGDEIRLSVAKQKSIAKLVVEDTGRGISKADLPSVFNRFYRSRKAKKDKVKGTGLGLAIANKILEHHEGGMGVKSKERKGTSFTVTLPVIS